MQEELIRLEEKGLLRELRALSMYKGEYFLNKKRILNFASNDYLNLSQNSSVRKAAIDAIRKYKCGTGASALVSGYFEIHSILEESLASLLAKERSIICGNGFLANLGILNALAMKVDEIYADKFVHASIIDGCLISKAKLFRYRHNDSNHLEELIKRRSSKGKKIIITESVFSMDGDIAPVRSLFQIAKSYNAFLIVDEAHALGVFGSAGGGICQDLGENCKPDIVVGTLSKALGSYGGFIACSDSMKQYLVNTVRPYIYSTSLPPASVAAAETSLNLIGNNLQWGARLLGKARLFHRLLASAGFKMQPFNSQIIPLHIGNNSKTVHLAKLLLEKYGILAPAIRPPTVPAGTARLRLSITLGHTKQQLLYTVDAITKASKELNII